MPLKENCILGKPEGKNKNKNFILHIWRLQMFHWGKLTCSRFNSYDLKGENHHAVVVWISLGFPQTDTTVKKTRGLGDKRKKIIGILGHFEIMLLTRRLSVKERPNFLRQIRGRTGRPRAGGGLQSKLQMHSNYCWLKQLKESTCSKRSADVLFIN